MECRRTSFASFHSTTDPLTHPPSHPPTRPIHPSTHPPTRSYLHISPATYSTDITLATLPPSLSTSPSPTQTPEKSSLCTPSTPPQHSS
ncbi:hypothetical protein E2C01_057906 [Portunus trituberculatus]|uniref:Uncharacterized protein n=1 Tax=Portunus trituberculatus TaxID=210409 RepID=A0A5B7GUR9_PORTR|nr:hypothetical protein [Portunus trituberculatus]